MPIPPGAQLYESGSDRELYDHYRDLGLTPDLAKHHVELRRSQRQTPVEETSTNPDLGALASGRIGLSQGLAGSGGALTGGVLGSALGPLGTIGGALIGGLAGGASVKPLTQALSAAPASEVTRQWDATVQAHPVPQLVGDVVGGLVGGGIAGKASKLFDMKAIRAARRVTAEARAARQPIITDIAQEQLKKLRTQIAAIGTPSPDAALRTSLTKAGIAPDALDAAVAAAKKAQVLPVRGTVEASAPNLDVPTAIRRGTVVQSPIDQRYAPAEGTLPYYPRGGLMEQGGPPPPVQSPTGLLGTQTLDRTDPKAVAAWLKDQIALAESFGQRVTPAKLSKLLEGFDPKIITQVTKLVR